ncbi:DUF4255 domain-containing protein [Streptomyces sp. NBC_01244]|uniref:DUF4255 domain-containing protein n=1 Tax=Streptomyces sp. NBC_01244 TaxID=2903797 RepID=UPI002E1195B0|nr:DUF4255 domain-containing protein [Streptomyces sp. NBC_01244]
MSRALALAAVTTAIRFILERALDPELPGAVAGAEATTRHPSKLAWSELSPQCGINVYCYQVNPQATGNVAALPTRRSDGSVMARPSASVDLHYLISCYGNDQTLEPQRLLGTALAALTATPVLTPALVAKAARHFGSADDAHPFLKVPDLATGGEPARLSPVTLSLEDTSSLWGMFGNDYVLSVAWLASAAVITSDDHVRVAPPVLVRTVSPRPTGGPLLESVGAEGPGPASAAAGATVVLRGHRLLGPGTRVSIGTAEFAPAEGSSDTEVRVGPLSGVPAGVHSVQVAHRSAPGVDGDPPAELLASSNVLPLLVRPTVTVGTPTASDLVFAFAPPLRKEQRVTLLLSLRSGGDPGTPPDLALDLPRVTAETSEQTLERGKVPAGSWLVRGRVDGVDSLPELVGSTFGHPVLVVGAPPP